ncbi:isocitrate lyase/phosphoenolpyruvate mutase family protein [Baekduia soli]|uniref:Isocitrate lyase/phosphoenolpyruvate mutase family protein n=1 Tax=Baekduia soli TaxID=496014 RepID=A0A5B8U1Y6_9ACTN|nr:isocitrate lyase/phosphoenolpyruvate mutase family protein [Baekduia soli]QEC47013.1 isocitrate lyase/phosphoenolpyruvate mutase family protein [Baekduia soli]
MADLDTAAARAQELLRLHADPAILVLVNVWDVASAQTVASVPGCRAIATASWAMAAAHGIADGEAIGRDRMLELVGEIAGAVALPVTADLESGYGETPAEVGETVGRAIAAGAVGCNLEDGVPGATLLRDAQDAARRVQAARERADREGVPVVINARTDVYLRGADDAEAALLRGRAYAAAGADCVFVPGVIERETIRALVEGIPAPVSVLARPGAPSVSELEALGVARVSFGPGPMGAALAALARTASQLLQGGAPADELGYRPSAD